jgi:hypothetical protein
VTDQSVRLLGILAISIGVLALVGDLVLKAPGDARKKALVTPWYFYGVTGLGTVAIALYLEVRGFEVAMIAVLSFAIARINLDLTRLCGNCGRVRFGGIGKRDVFCGDCGSPLEKLESKSASLWS